jgi:leucine dehydrogenase
MRKFGEFVHWLSGRYITAEDVGMETRDMDIVRDVTPYVTGISEERRRTETHHLLLLTECT